MEHAAEISTAAESRGKIHDSLVIKHPKSAGTREQEQDS